VRRSARCARRTTSPLEPRRIVGCPGFSNGFPPSQSGAGDSGCLAWAEMSRCIGVRIHERPVEPPPTFRLRTRLPIKTRDRPKTGRAARARDHLDKAMAQACQPPRAVRTGERALAGSQESAENGVAKCGNDDAWPCGTEVVGNADGWRDSATVSGALSENPSGPSRMAPGHEPPCVAVSMCRTPAQRGGKRRPGGLTP
jgi:hypothetical protein